MIETAAPTRSLSLWALVLLAGCAGSPSAFSARFPDNQRAASDALAQALREAPRPAPRTVAVGVTPAPTRIFGVDLQSQRVLWQQATELDQAPMLAGTLVLLQQGDQVKAFDLTSGQLVRAIPTGGLQLVGAAGDGSTAVMSLSLGNGTAARSEVVLLRDGSVAWRRPLDQRVGAPAQAGDVVLVPWGSQFLSALHARDGVEFARLRVPDGVLAQVFFSDGKAYAGGPEGATDVALALQSNHMRGPQFIAAPQTPLPGRPDFLRDVYSRDGVLRPDSAGHSIRLLWSPRQSGGLTDESLYLVFYRFVVALHYPDLAVRWVYTHDADIIGAEAGASVVTLADRNGRFMDLNTIQGKPARTFSTDLQATAIVLPRNSAIGSGAEGVPVSDPQRLREQLRAAAQDPDSRLVPLRRFAVERLAQLSDPAATGDLLALCNDPLVAPAVQGDACEALTRRKEGRELIVAALDRHYDYLAGIDVPPVGALARAVLALNAKEAYPALVSHLEDPHTPSTALPDLVQAIATLNPAQAIAPLSTFCHRYHADPVDEHVIRAVEEAIVALFTVQGPLAIETLIDLAEDRLSLQGIRDKAAASLTQLEETSRLARQQQEADAQAAGEQATQGASDGESGAAGPQPEEEAEPERLTLAVVERTLRPVKHELRTCLAQSTGNLFHGRMVLVVRDGAVELVSVTPSELQGCVEPLVRAQTFPRTQRSGRQQISYELSRK